MCLFTCLAVRAIHLEVVLDMTAEQFLLCQRRFIATRGKPKQIISDYTSQFKVAKSTVEDAWELSTTRNDTKNYTKLATTPSEHVLEKRRIFPPCKSVVVLDNKKICFRDILSHLNFSLFCLFLAEPGSLV